MLWVIHREPRPPGCTCFVVQTRCLHLAAKGVRGGGGDEKTELQTQSLKTSEPSSPYVAQARAQLSRRHGWERLLSTRRRLHFQAHSPPCGRLATPEPQSVSAFPNEARAPPCTHPARARSRGAQDTAWGSPAQPQGALVLAVAVLRGERSERAGRRVSPGLRRVRTRGRRDPNAPTARGGRGSAAARSAGEGPPMLSGPRAA